jgi:hypothetical protein
VGFRKLCHRRRTRYINSICRKLPFTGAWVGFRLDGSRRSEAGESSAFDVDPADLIFARARETIKERIEDQSAPRAGDLGVYRD